MYPFVEFATFTSPNDTVVPVVAVDFVLNFTLNKSPFSVIGVVLFVIIAIVNFPAVASFTTIRSLQKLLFNDVTILELVFPFASFAVSKYVVS
jgi:hypothetical protein